MGNLELWSLGKRLINAPQPHPPISQMICMKPSLQHVPNRVESIKHLMDLFNNTKYLPTFLLSAALGANDPDPQRYNK